MKLSISINGYSLLVKKVTRELIDLELFVKQRTAQSYWNVGKYIHEHLLENKDRADYGATLYEKLAQDVDRDKSSLLRATQFYRTYPILAERRQLNWNHYKALITIKDDNERKKLEDRILRKNWDAQKLREYLSTKRKQPPQHPVLGRSEPIPQLAFTRGRLNTYRIVKAVEPLTDKSSYALDLGFRLQLFPPKNSPHLKENDCLELIFTDLLTTKNSPENRKKEVSTDYHKRGILREVSRKGILTGSQKSDTPPEELFTYQAHVEKAIDGDTLLVSFDFQLDVTISQKLRLRGIDCPEVDTKEGQAAKRFVASHLKGCDFIIVKTYKDRTDRFDRYLADVFYKAGETDPAVVAKEGIYLNQELLNERLAVKY